MARDPKLWKRNALAIPGGLLVLYALAGLLYVLFYRAPTPACAVAHRFLVQSHCYSAYPFLAAILILGLALVVVGLVVFRGKPTELPGHLHSGTPTHFTLALLGSLVLVPSVVWMVLYYVEASQGLAPFMTSLRGYNFQTKGLFLLLAIGAALALVPFVGLYVAQGRLRRTFLRKVEEVAAQEAEPFPGEEASTAPPADPLAVPPEEFMDESLWPDSRTEEKVVTTPPTLPPGAGNPTAAKAAPAAASAPPAPAVLPPRPIATVPPAAAQPPAPAPSTSTVAASATLPPYLTAPPAKAPMKAEAPVVTVAAGCRAILPSGNECSKSVGPGGRYCLTHACQARTAAGTPCKNPAMEGSTKCPAHSQ